MSALECSDCYWPVESGQPCVWMGSKTVHWSCYAYGVPQLLLPPPPLTLAQLRDLGWFEASE